MNPFLRSVLLLSLLSLLEAGCGSAGTPGSSLAQRILDARIANSTPSRFIGPSVASAGPRASLLLFVHGVFGDTLTTWKREDQEKGLPALVLDRPEFSSGFDAFVFGFPSDKIKQGSLSIPEAAAVLLAEIDLHQLLQKYRRIVIVSHSMGGLVALEALTTDSDLRAHVPLVIAFATPYDGAQVAKLGKEVLENPAIADMVPIDSGNSLLLSLTQRWRRAKERDTMPTAVRCAYEKVPLPVIGFVVPPTSALSLCEDVSEPIAEDHLGIVKPSSPDHASVRVITNALRTLPDLSHDASDPDATVGSPTVEPTILRPEALTSLKGSSLPPATSRPLTLLIGSCVGRGGQEGVRLWGPTGELCNGIVEWGRYDAQIRSVRTLGSCVGGGGFQGVRLYGPVGEPCGGMENNAWGAYDSPVDVFKIGISSCLGHGNVLSGHRLWGPAGAPCGGFSDSVWGRYSEFNTKPK